MSNFSNAYLRSVVFLGASLALGRNIAVAQDQSTSRACGQQPLAGKEGDNEDSGQMRLCDPSVSGRRPGNG